MDESVPFKEAHYTVATVDHLPQPWVGTSRDASGLKEMLEDVIELAQRLPGFLVFYNGEGAGATISHHRHFQRFGRDANVDLVYVRLPSLIAATDHILSESRPKDDDRSPVATPERARGNEGETAAKMKRRKGRRNNEAQASSQALRDEIERAAKTGSRLRWNPDPDDVQRSVVKLVLTLIEFIRKLMERQAVRRLEEGTLTPAETEAVGAALMKLEQTILAIGKQFTLDPDELNLDLGPLGKLM